MKLALIRRQFAAVGGAELYVQRLLTALVTAGHEVHLYAEKWQGAHSGVIMHSVPVKANRAIGPIAFAEALSRLLNEADYDVVFSLERTIIQDVYRAGDGLHRVWLKQRKRYASWWRRPFVGLGAFHANMQALESRTFDPANTRHIIANSTMVKQEILSHFPFPAERIHIIPNGVETSRFQNLDRHAMRTKFGFKDEDFVLLFVGSGWERKGLPFLLRLMRQWQSSQPEVKLLVVGKGRLGSKPPPNVILAGPMPKVEEAYAAADLMTFLPIYEPCANVIAEALSSGLPVITSRFNGACELIQPEINGHILEDPADLPALETAIQFWKASANPVPITTVMPLDLDSNVQSTLRLLESVALEKKLSR